MPATRSPMVAAVALTLAVLVASPLPAAPPRDGRAGTASAPAPRQGVRPPHVVERSTGELFKGIRLSAAQRTRVRLIQSKYADRMREISRSLRPPMQALGEAQARGDTAAAKQAWIGSAPQRAEFQRVGRTMRAEIREVLTPEQRQRFDANAKAVEARAAGLDRRYGMPARP